VTELSIERAARNETVFRDANELLEARREELSTISGRTPFLCECADPRCTGVIPLTLEEYRRVREQPNRFVLEPGHATAETDVVEQSERFVVVEKHGRAGEIAEETDPRS
jgi:hypothetical protein